MSHISFFFFPGYSTQGHDYLSTCVMETFPPWLEVPSCFHYNTTIHLPPVSWRRSGSAAAIWGSIQTYNTASFVATYQQPPHLFNADLEGEANGWVEVLMIPSPSHRAHGTKETAETEPLPGDTWIISDKAPPPAVLPPWIIYRCTGLDQLVNLSTAALN